MTASPSFAPRLLALLGALLLCGCFIPPQYECRLLCRADDDCPGNYKCLPLGDTSGSLVCRTDKACPIGPEPDGGPRDGATVETPPPEPGPGPPPEKICYPGPEHCLTLSPELQAGLALWLDPGNLPADGQPIPVWFDQSGKANHARAATQAIPVVSEGAARMVSSPGAGFRVAYHPSLEPGREPFTVFVIARVGSAATCFMARHNDRDGSLRRRWAIDWLPRPGLVGLRPGAVINTTEAVALQRQDIGDLRPHLIMAARTGDQLHLVIDGSAVAPVAVASDVDLTTDHPLYLGTCYEGILPVRFLNAVVIVRGELSDPDRTAVSKFLMEAFQIMP